ncbi:MAG: rhomboid family intramembrane serine protease [Thermomicrobiales bacterium]
MFLIGDENRGQRLTPWVNYTLLALNVLIFFYQLSLSETELVRFVVRWGVIPDEVSGGEDLYTLISAMFVHGGWLHLIGNMLFLWVFGDNVEDTMGHIKYLLFYLLCGFAASAGQVLFNTGSATPMVGASGAISGVLAAYLVMFPTGRIKTLILLGWIPFIFLVPAWVHIGFWIVLQFINGIAALDVRTAETGGGVAYFAHIGGFVAGLALVWLFRDRDAYERQKAAREGHHAWQRMRWGEQQ